MLISIIRAKILLPLNILWMRLGLLLGVIISPIVLGFIFFVILFILTKGVCPINSVMWLEYFILLLRN